MKAEKQTKFLDELTDTVHEFIQHLSPARQFVLFIKIGISSHKDIAFDLEDNLENAEVVAYIKKSGKRDSEKLIEILKNCSVLVSKINSLVAKGQVLGFKNYENCQRACRFLTWQYERIEALAYIIGQDSLNWMNPQVQSTIGKVTSIDPDEVNKYIEESNTSFLTFVKDAYETIYK